MMGEEEIDEGGQRPWSGGLLGGCGILKVNGCRGLIDNKLLEILLGEDVFDI